jgi:hypothetical protein
LWNYFSETFKFFQDFDDWDDVGLNIAQPPNLLRLYRDYDKHAMPMAASTLAKTEEENAKLVRVLKNMVLYLVDIK